MMIFLYIVFGYLTITTLILLLNRKDFTPLCSVTPQEFDSSAPLVSVCIPARNEEHNIARCIHSVIIQSYPNVEILVLDDRSTDNTLSVLQDLKSKSSSTFKIIHGAPKPEGWLGKQWACQQLADRAEGDILVFMDADTWLKPAAISRVVKTMGYHIVELLTIWPMQDLKTFWEKNVIPLVYYNLLSLLPARYVYRVPRWIPYPFRRRSAPLFSAACGQFMAFKRNAYEAIGGHSAVRNQVVEDVALAKTIRKAEFRMRMYHGRDSVSCRMYRSGKELFQGFRKNFLAGFEYSVLSFITMGFIHVLVYILPFPLFIIAFLNGSVTWTLTSLCAILTIWLHRFILAKWFNWDLLPAFLHPLGVLWFQVLGIKVLRDYFGNVPVSWKERTI